MTTSDFLAGYHPMDDALIEAGYHRFKPHKGAFNTDAFQKGVRDGKKLLYSIEVYKWHFPQVPNYSNPPSYEFEVTFYQSSSEEAVRMITSGNSLNITRVEEMFAHAYKVLGFIPDPHND